MNNSEEVLAAKTDERLLNSLIESYKPWILRCASETAHRYITDSDDEWSIALIAFSEAVQSYDEEKGPFKVFATVVIRRRVLDYLRSEGRHKNEFSASPDVFEGNLPEDDGATVPLQPQVQRRMAAEAATAAVEEDLSRDAKGEIGEVQAMLSLYGFSFFDLAECSPKAEKTRRSCAIAVLSLIGNPELIDRMRQRRMLPVKELASASGVQRKILDRHRKYIIAAAEILSGDFPIISAYLHFIRQVS